MIGYSEHGNQSSFINSSIESPNKAYRVNPIMVQYKPSCKVIINDTCSDISGKSDKQISVAHSKQPFSPISQSEDKESSISRCQLKQLKENLKKTNQAQISKKTIPPRTTTNKKPKQHNIADKSLNFNFRKKRLASFQNSSQNVLHKKPEQMSNKIALDFSQKQKKKNMRRYEQEINNLND